MVVFIVVLTVLMLLLMMRTRLRCLHLRIKILIAPPRKPLRKSEELDITIMQATAPKTIKARAVSAAIDVMVTTRTKPIIVPERRIVAIKKTMGNLSPVAKTKVRTLKLGMIAPHAIEIANKAPIK